MDAPVAERDLSRRISDEAPFRATARDWLSRWTGPC